MIIYKLLAHVTEIFPRAIDFGTDGINFNKGFYCIKYTPKNVYDLSLLYRLFSKERLYIDDVLSPNNSRFGDFGDRVYPIELEIKETTHTPTTGYLDNRCYRELRSYLRHTE